MRVLVLCGDYWHPASVVREGLTPLEEKGFTFDYVEDASAWAPDQMQDYPVVMVSKSNNVSEQNRDHWMTPEVETAFRDYVAGGGGLFITHSGTAGYRETEVFRALTGGYFTTHPEQCPVTVEPQPDHPLTAGATQFTLTDEHYHMALDEPNLDVYVATTSEHGTQPGAWVRTEGEGRVCVLTPGHNVEVWLNPSFQKLLENGLRWSSKSL